MTMTPEERQKYEEQSKANIKKANEKNSLIGCGVLIAIVVLVMALGPCSGKKDGKSETSIQTVTIGSQGILNTGGETIILGSTKDNYNEVLKSITAKDTRGVAELVLMGQAFFVSSGTKVLVIDRSMFVTKVRILEGGKSGHAGWIDTEFIKPIQ